jgi:hypothetical protein
VGQSLKVESVGAEGRPRALGKVHEFYDMHERIGTGYLDRQNGNGELSFVSINHYTVCSGVHLI